MFIYTVKAQGIKLALSLIASVLVIAFVVWLFPTSNGDFVYPDDALPAVKAMSSSDFKNVKSNEDRIEFLKKYGWEVCEEASEIKEVSIPTEFDPIYEDYNQLQISEGLDLKKYRGKTVKRYTYQVSNYDYDGTVYANLLIYKDSVIGGDVCSARTDGFVHGFTKGNDFLS